MKYEILKYKTLRWLLLLSLSTALFTFCNKDEGSWGNNGADQRIINLSGGEEYQLEATFRLKYSDTITVKWNYGDPAIIRVADSTGVENFTLEPIIENNRVSGRDTVEMRVTATTKIVAQALDITQSSTITLRAGDRTVKWHITVFAGEQPSTEDPGIVIEGIKWATRNVNTPGNFAAEPEVAGQYYQWNNRRGWSATGDRSEWDNLWNGGSVWEPENDPCPAGWRIPTTEELESLIASGSRVVTQKGVSGRLFADTLFLPAAGYLDRNGGTPLGQGGFYWSSDRPTGSAPYAYLLNFGISATEINDNFQALGLSCRCVEDK